MARPMGVPYSSRACRCSSCMARYSIFLVFVRAMPCGRAALEMGRFTVLGYRKGTPVPDSARLVPRRRCQEARAGIAGRAGKALQWVDLPVPG